MDESYKKKIDFPINDRNQYFGIFKENKLAAYLWIVKTGQLALMNRILGNADDLDSGMMYLLTTTFIADCIDKPNEIKYAMYDTIFGAKDGLLLFKKRCGFKPYIVVWKQKK